MGAGTVPEDVLTALADEDPGFAERQVALVDAAGRSAVWTGRQCLPWAGGWARPGLALAGNILVGREVLEAMDAAYEAAPHEALGRRLLSALQAGDRAGGDRRGRQSAAVVVMPLEGSAEWPPRARVDHAWTTTPTRWPSWSGCWTCTSPTTSTGPPWRPPNMGAVTPDYDVAALGAIVRRTRQRMGLSVEALAARSDLSAGLISQLERGRGNPSLQTLSRLASALGTQLVSLLQSAQRRGEPVVRADARTVLPDLDPAPDGAPRPDRKLLTPDQNLPLQVIRTVMPPGFSNEDRPFRPLGLESVHVLEGELLVVLGETRHALAAGDTITYECTQAHWWANPSDTDEVVIIGSVAPFAG